MPTSIIEDSSRLRPSGRLVCIILFFTGVAALLTSFSHIGKATEIIKNQSAQDRIATIADSMPEEMSFVLPPVTEPKTTEENIIRTRNIESTLNVLTAEAKRDPRFQQAPDRIKNPKKIVALGVIKGIIHPKEAQRILQEVNTLNITPNLLGYWEVNGDKTKTQEGKDTTKAVKKPAPTRKIKQPTTSPKNDQ